MNLCFPAKICNECKEILEREKVSEIVPVSRCQKCGGTLEELEGYYDRHPEYR
jgi:uncharacterized protein with PIN domain